MRINPINTITFQGAAIIRNHQGKYLSGSRDVDMPEVHQSIKECLDALPRKKSESQILVAILEKLGFEFKGPFKKQFWSDSTSGFTDAQGNTFTYSTDKNPSINIFRDNIPTV